MCVGFEADHIIMNAIHLGIVVKLPPELEKVTSSIPVCLEKFRQVGYAPS